MRSPTRLLLVALAALLPSCERHSTVKNDAEWWRLEGDRQASAQRLTLLQNQLNRALAARGETGDLGTESLNLADAKAALEKQRNHLNNDIAGLDDQVKEARHQWEVSRRDAMLGKMFVSLTSRSGRTYEDVTITRVTDAGIEFRHAKGSARFGAYELTPRQMEDFGIESDDAFAAHRQEMADNHAYLKAVDQARAAQAADKDDDDTAKTASNGRGKKSTASNSGSSSSSSSSSASRGSGGGSVANGPVIASNSGLSGTGSRSRLNEGPRSVGRSSSDRSYSSRPSAYYYGPGFYWNRPATTTGYTRGGGTSTTAVRGTPSSPVVVQPQAPRPPVVRPTPAPAPAVP